MANINYFNSQLPVHFSLDELYEISSALATETFSEREQGRQTNSQIAWDLRVKVNQFIDLYKNSLVL